MASGRGGKYGPCRRPYKSRRPGGWQRTVCWPPRNGSHTDLAPSIDGASAEPKDLKGDNPLVEGQEQGKSLWGGLAEAAGAPWGKAGAEEVWAKPLPYMCPKMAESGPDRARGCCSQRMAETGPDRARGCCSQRMAESGPDRARGCCSQRMAETGPDRARGCCCQMAEFSGVRFSPLNRTSGIKLMKTVSFSPQGRIMGCPRDPSTPVAREDKSTSILPALESSALVASRQQRRSPQRGGLRCIGVMLILGLVTIRGAASEPHPQQPSRWVLRDPARGDEVIKENITADAPTFTVTIGDLFPIVGGPKSKSLWGTYWCPSSNPGMSYCDYPGYGFCGYWGCETIVTSDRWSPDRDDDFLRVTWGPNGCDRPKFASDGMVYHRGTCTHWIVTVLQPTDAGWAVGRRWSVFIHKAFTDLGTVIEVIRLVPQAPQAIGPNPVLNPPIPTPLPDAARGNAEVTTPAMTRSTKIPDEQSSLENDASQLPNPDQN